MALTLSTAVDYAVRAMIHIACLPEETVVLRSRISQSEAIPPSFSAKILRRLVRGGLLRSARGVQGGFSLARPASEITLLDLVEAMEGPLDLMRCATHASRCEHSCDCPASLVWPLVQNSLRASLGAVTLESLVSTPRSCGRVRRGAQAEAGGAADAAHTVLRVVPKARACP